MAKSPATSKKITINPDTPRAWGIRRVSKPARTARAGLHPGLIIAVLAACIAGVCAISFSVLIHQSLRLDEAQSLWQSSHSLNGLLHAVALDVHVPLYHLILHFWIFYFGDGVVTVRLLSLLFFICTIPIMYLLARQLLSQRWALFAVVLFSFSPFLDWYANEARMYSLLLLISALNQLFFVRLARTGKGWFWYGLTAIIGAYSHYFFMFNLAAQALYFIANRRSFPRRSLWRFLVVALLVLAALAPWLYYFHSLGSASGTRPHLTKPSTVDFFNVYSQFLFGFQTNYVNTIFLSAWPVIMLFALAAIRRSQGLSTELKFVMTMSTVPVLLAYVVSLFITPFFLSRYMVLSVAPALLLLVWLVSRYRRPIALAGAAALLLITALTSTLQASTKAIAVKEDYRQVVSDINQTIQPQDAVVLSAPFTIYPFEYYYHGTAQISTLPLWDRTDAGAIPGFNAAALPAQVNSINQNHRYIYLVLSEDQGYEDTVYKYYLTHFKQISHKTYSPDLSLYVYKVGYYTVPRLGTPAALAAAGQ